MLMHNRFGVMVEDVRAMIEAPSHFYSQTSQDLFALGLNNYKKNGTWLDIGCSCPREANNTYLLEKYGWSGINIDIREFENLWAKERKTPFIPNNALDIDYKSLLSQYYKTTTIDYLSLDIDDASFKVLKMLPLDLYKFNFITIEHDIYDVYPKNKDRKEEQKHYLINNGYTLLIENLSYKDSAIRPYEDWFVSAEIAEKLPIRLANILHTDALSVFNFKNRDEVLNG